MELNAAKRLRSTKAMQTRAALSPEEEAEKVAKVLTKKFGKPSSDDDWEEGKFWGVPGTAIDFSLSVTNKGLAFEFIGEDGEFIAEGKTAQALIKDLKEQASYLIPDVDSAADAKCCRTLKKLT